MARSNVGCSIGSRSRSEALKDKNIRKLMYQSQNTSKEHQKARKLLIQKLKASQEQAAQCFDDLNKKELTKEELLGLYKPNEAMTWEQQMDDQVRAVTFGVLCVNANDLALG
jgi:phosphatidate phosphatase PAH1